MIAVSLLVVGYLFVGLRRAMLQAIGQIEAGVGRMAQGRLDEQVVVTSRDAFGDIAGALNGMQSKLLAKISADKVVAESNLRVRNALDKANTNVMLADTDGQIVYCNEAVINTRCAMPSATSARSYPRFRSMAWWGVTSTSSTRARRISAIFSGGCPVSTVPR